MALGEAQQLWRRPSLPAKAGDPVNAELELEPPNVN
jgi:hypothetical protein